MKPIMKFSNSKYSELWNNHESGADSEGIRGSTEPPSLWLKITFSWEILDKFVIQYYLLIFTTLTLYLILLFNKSILLSVNECKIARWVAK